MRDSESFQQISGELLSDGHGVRFRAEGQSMHPTIRGGEAITVEPVKPSDVKRGDILLYRSATGVTAHRVVAISRTEQGGLGNEQEIQQQPGDHSILSAQSASLSPDYFFILRGDALSTCDAPVESARVLGKVVSVERHGRRIPLSDSIAKIAHNLRVCARRLARQSGMSRLCRTIVRTAAPGRSEAM